MTLTMDLNKLQTFSDRIAKNLYKKYKHILYMEEDDVKQQCCVHILERFNPDLNYQFCYRECKSRIIDSIRVLRYMSKDNVSSFTEVYHRENDDKVIQFKTYYNKLSDEDREIIQSCMDGISVAKIRTKVSQKTMYKRYNELKDEIKWILN